MLSTLQRAYWEILIIVSGNGVLCDTEMFQNREATFTDVYVFMEIHCIFVCRYVILKKYEWQMRKYCVARRVTYLTDKYM